ncbi:MAG: hypothetical protein GF393_12375 [Armatimonadia bacterium]|nr:hypothetical protein [Armatimonadia bacterium]
MAESHAGGRIVPAEQVPVDMTPNLAAGEPVGLTVQCAETDAPADARADDGAAAQEQAGPPPEDTVTDDDGRRTLVKVFSILMGLALIVGIVIWRRTGRAA